MKGYAPRLQIGRVLVQQPVSGGLDMVGYDVLASGAQYRLDLQGPLNCGGRDLDFQDLTSA
jgi:hypothetical protein